MRRLLDIIAKDEETILTKDKEIFSLQNILQEKDNIIKSESTGISKKEMEEIFTKTLEEKSMEISNMKKETESQFFFLKVEMEAQKKIIVRGDLEIEELKSDVENQLQVIQTQEAIKIKCEELMKIILKQNGEIEATRNSALSHEELSKNKSLQKNIFTLEASIKQKDLDIESLKDYIRKKETIFCENNTKNEQYIRELDLWQKTVQNAEEIVKASTFLKDNEEMIKTLQLKIVNEQEINDQAEEEIIQLRIELDNLKKEISDNKTEQEQNGGLLEEQKETEKLKDLNLQADIIEIPNLNIEDTKVCTDKEDFTDDDYVLIEDVEQDVDMKQDNQIDISLG